MQMLPGGDAIHLDHLAHFVPDLEATAAALERMGFLPTPVAVQQNRTEHGMVPAGMANRCTMLRQGYLEFLTAVSDTGLARQFHKAIARYTGVHLVAMGVDRPDAAFDALQQNGFAPTPPVNLTRPAPAPEGQEPPEARFTVIRVPPGTMPEGRIQILKHHTPDIVWQERFMAHPNAVVSLEAVLMIVADAAATAARYGRFLNRQPETLGAGHSIVRFEHGCLVFVEPEALAATQPAIEAEGPLPRIAAYCVGSADVAETERVFRAGGLEGEVSGKVEKTWRLPSVLGGFMTVCPRDAGPTWSRPTAP